MMDESNKDSKMFLRYANKIRKSYKPKLIIMKNENNLLKTDEQFIAEEFKRIFKKRWINQN